MKKFKNYFQDLQTSSVNFSHFSIRNDYHFKVFLDLSWIWRFVVNSRNLRRWFHGNIIVWPLRNLQKLHDASKNGPVGAYFFSLWLQNRHLSTIGKLFLLNRCSIDFNYNLLSRHHNIFNSLNKTKNAIFGVKKNEKWKSNRIYRQCVWMILSFDESVYLSDKLNSIFLLVILGLAWLEGGYLIKRKPMMEWN